MFEVVPAKLDRWVRDIAGAGFTRYLVANGSAVVVSVGMRHGLGYVVPFHASVVLAYLFSMIGGYLLLQALQVFPPSGRSMLHDFMRVWPVPLASLALAWTVSALFRQMVLPAASITWYAADIAYMAGILSTPLPNYLMMRWLLAPKP